MEQPLQVTRSGRLRYMHRLLVIALAMAVLATSSGAAAQTAPEAAQGVNVIPDPESSRKSPNGAVVELGTVDPGQPVTDNVIVRSSFDEPREVLLYAADAQPAAGGGFGFRLREEPQEQVGSWLDLSQERVTVPADGQVRVSYTLTVPAGTRGGEYVGAVVAEPADQGEGGGVQTRTRFAMPVYLTVPGGSVDATPGRGEAGGTLVLEQVVTAFDGNQACPVVRYRNDSQDVIDPVATVTSEGPLGRSTYTKERIGALLPDTTGEAALPCIDRALGSGRLDVELSSPRGGGRESTSYTWLPWPFLLSFLLLILLIGALITTFRRGITRKRAIPPSDAAEREPA